MTTTRAWIDRLQALVTDRRTEGLWRTLHAAPCHADVIDLSSNDYLRLSPHRKLIHAVQQAAADHGVGSGASRLVSGTQREHLDLERKFAQFKGAQAALLFPTGFAANLGVLTALGRSGSFILADRLSHASIIDGARLAEAQGARFRTFAHLDYQRCAHLAAACRERDPHAQLIIVTDTVFSMDGDMADLDALAELRDRFDAILVVDDAHGTGVLGEDGQGADREHAADVTISTASKALGSLGGIVTSRAEVIDWLVNAARSFIYTTAVPPTQVAAIGAALDVVRDEPWRRERLRDLAAGLRSRLRIAGYDVRDDPTPIVPLIMGSSEKTMALQAHLNTAGIRVGAIRPPTVPRGTARLRLSVHCELTEGDLDRVVAELGSLQ